MVQSGETIVVETATQHAGDDYDKVHSAFMAFHKDTRCFALTSMHSFGMPWLTKRFLPLLCDLMPD